MTQQVIEAGETALTEVARAARGLALRLDGRPPHVVDTAAARPWLVLADAAASALAAAAGVDEARFGVPAQVAAQRLAGWRTALGRAEAVAAAASEADRALAALLTQGRLILHRYARHFGGQQRSTRDLGRLVEARVALVAIARAARGLVADATDATLLAEARALPKFIEFLIQEQGEITDNLGAAGRFEQAASLAAVAATLSEGWEAEVLPVPPLARSLRLMDRQLRSLAEVLDHMGAVRHANLPEAHEQAIAAGRARQRRWQAERQRTHDAQVAAGPRACWDAVCADAWAQWRALRAEVASPDTDEEAAVAEGQGREALLADLRARCDRLEATRGLLDPSAPLAQAVATIADLATPPRANDLRDGLIWLGQRHDRAVG